VDVRKPSPTPADKGLIVTSAFVIDLAARRVNRAVAEIHLTPIQWHLVEILVRERGRLVTQRRLMSEVWGPACTRQTHYLRVFLAQIRGKLEPDPSHPRYFVTERGMGYRFDESAGARTTPCPTKRTTWSNTDTTRCDQDGTRAWQLDCPHRSCTAACTAF
jgi:DNA-binding response OmpR family regulator